MHFDITDKEKGSELKHIVAYVDGILIGRFKPDDELAASVTWQAANLLLRGNPIAKVYETLIPRYPKSAVDSAIELISRNLNWYPPVLLEFA